MLQLDYIENGFPIGHLLMDNSPLILRAGMQPADVAILGRDSTRRAEVEAFIRGVYRASYGAEIEVHYPTLVSLRDDKDALLGAVGFRSAADDVLFLEQYLDVPVQSMVGTPRGGIVEIGNLAAAGGGGSAFLYMALIAYLQKQGVITAVLTATSTLEKRLRTLGWQLQRLCVADPALLDDDQTRWGTYYETMPYVVAGSVAQAWGVVQEMFGGDYVPSVAGVGEPGVRVGGF